MNKSSIVIRLFKTFGNYEKFIKSSSGEPLPVAISKQLVEMHGGRITAESRYGVGGARSLLCCRLRGRDEKS